MAINFPPSPLRLQLYTYDGVTYIWTGSEWKVYVLKNTNNSFNKIQIEGREQFDAFSYRDINFQGINVNIFSADTNTLVFSASPQTSSSSIFTGGTVTGPTNFTGGLTSNTISATTYNNLPKDVFVTGGTYSSGTATFTNSTGGTFSVSGFSTSTGDSFTGGSVSGSTNFTNGLTANTISATTYYNLPTDIFVTGGTYTNGDVTFTNNTGGTFTVTGFAIGGGGGQLFYLNLSQTQGSNRYLSTTASTAAEQSTGSTIAAGATGTIASFQSDELGVTLIPGGIWAFYLHSYKQNNNASFNIFVEVYKRTSGGTETLLFTTDPTAVTTNSPNPSMGLSDTYFSGTPILVTDSIVATVRATNTSNQSRSVTLFSEGSQHYSYVVSTLPTQQGLTCDTLSGCSVIQTINTNISNKFDKSGGTVNGDVRVNGTGQKAISAFASNSGTSYGIYSYATKGTNAYGVYGVASAGEFDSITNGIGGYFAADNSNGGDPTNRYSLQLVDGTEGIDKVLTSVTSDGKANWSNVLTGLTNVRSTTISATTYQNLPTTISSSTTFVSGLTTNTLKISTTPTLNNSSSQVLTINTSTGNVEQIPINQIKTNGTNLYLFYNY